MKRFGIAALALLLSGCHREASPSSSQTPVVRATEGYLKGQLHAHSDASADSDTPVDEVVRYYRAHGYDFLVITDHNVVTAPPSPEGMLVLPGVEITQNQRVCTPPPLPGLSCLLHVNALFVKPPWPPRIVLPEPDSITRFDLYSRAVGAAKSLGGIAELNHPNFHWAADADLLTALAARGLMLVEVANEAVDSGNDGDVAHPSTEALWDTALTRGAKVFATASDDAHNYSDADRVRARGKTAYTGDRGFVMVHAANDAASIRRAIESGDFYASTGLVFSRVDLSMNGIAVDVGEDALIEVVGEGGAVIAHAEGRTLRFDPKTIPSSYWRVRARTPDKRRAFTQPLFRGSSK